MPSVAISGSDTLKINQRPLADLADGDVGALDFPNELMNVKTGKNGNTLYAFNESGKQCDLTIRLPRGTADDKFLNNLLQLMKNNPAGFVLMNGEFTKRIGDGNGNITKDTYLMSGGVFGKEVPASSNAEGNTDQSVSVYHFKFTNAPRTMT